MTNADEVECVRAEIAAMDRDDLEALALAYWRLLEEHRGFDFEKARDLMTSAQVDLYRLEKMIEGQLRGTAAP